MKLDLAFESLADSVRTPTLLPGLSSMNSNQDLATPSSVFNAPQDYEKELLNKKQYKLNQEFQNNIIEIISSK